MASNKELQEVYNQVSIETANNLRDVAKSLVHQDVSRLSLPEIDQISDMVGRMLPAGNIPGLILNGLARLPGRKPPRDTVRRDIDVLFNGIHQGLEKAMYGALFAGPAAVIWGYQNILKLAGKDTDEAFPDGTWQFYVEYALREDTARHSNETIGFERTLRKYNIQLSTVDRMTALVMAAIHVLHDYDALLENEWRERFYTHALTEVTRGTDLEADAAKVYRQWTKQLVYSRGRDAEADESYVIYRRRKFDEFFESVIDTLDMDLKAAWLQQVREAKTHALPMYQQQMSILSYLEPSAHYEVRIPIPITSAYIGLIVRGDYYLIPAAQANGEPPSDDEVRGQIAKIMIHSPNSLPESLVRFAATRRAKLPFLFEKLSPEVVDNLKKLQHAPILINCGVQGNDAPLAEIRQGERGIGSHGLTIFDTGQSLVFDQSHIYFDGAWGAALAEIMTNEALAWAIYLSQLDTPEPAQDRPQMLEVKLSAADRAAIKATPRTAQETSVESDGVDLKRLQRLRRMFKSRNDLLQLTVNDLLVLYRAIHGLTYVPDPRIEAQLEQIVRSGGEKGEAARSALSAIRDNSNPAILIPVDASQGSPKDRLYPMSFEVPIADLNLIRLHQAVIEALDGYDRAAAGERAAYYQEFNTLQREYLATLAGFGAILTRAKEIALSGESASVGAIKLLAHISPPLQKLLDQVPGRFDMLNDILKGREVFSNVGVVAPTSSLTRFITAKDDNEKKTLAWGIITDAEGVMWISLRDFRSHVGLLQDTGHGEIAYRIAQHYLTTYINGLNAYIEQLYRITMASRETVMMREEDIT